MPQPTSSFDSVFQRYMKQGKTKDQVYNAMKKKFANDPQRMNELNSYMSGGTYSIPVETTAGKNAFYGSQSISNAFDRYRKEGKNDDQIYEAMKKRFAGNTSQLKFLDNYMKNRNAPPNPATPTGVTPSAGTTPPTGTTPGEENWDFSSSRPRNSITTTPEESPSNRTNAGLKSNIPYDTASGVMDVENAIDDRTNKLYVSQQQSNARIADYQNDAANREKARIDEARKNLESDSAYVRSQLEKADKYLESSHKTNVESYSKRTAAQKDAMRSKLAAQGVSPERIEQIINEQIDQSAGKLQEQQALGDTYQGNLRKSAEAFQTYIDHYQSNVRNLNADEKSVIEAVKDSLIAGENKLEGIKQSGITAKTQPLIDVLNAILEKKKGNAANEIDRQDFENEYARNVAGRKGLLYQKLWSQDTQYGDLRGSLTDAEWSDILAQKNGYDALIKAEQYMDKHRVERSQTGTQTTNPLSGLGSDTKGIGANEGASVRNTDGSVNQDALIQRIMKNDVNKFVGPDNQLRGTWSKGSNGEITFVWGDKSKISFWVTPDNVVHYGYRKTEGGPISYGVVGDKKGAAPTSGGGAKPSGATPSGAKPSANEVSTNQDIIINTVFSADQAKFNNNKALFKKNPDGTVTYTWDAGKPNQTSITFTRDPKSGKIRYDYYKGTNGKPVKSGDVETKNKSTTGEQLGRGAETVTSMVGNFAQMDDKNFAKIVSDNIKDFMSKAKLPKGGLSTKDAAAFRNELEAAMKTGQDITGILEKYKVTGDPKKIEALNSFKGVWMKVADFSEKMAKFAIEHPKIANAFNKIGKVMPGAGTMKFLGTAGVGLDAATRWYSLLKNPDFWAMFSKEGGQALLEGVTSVDGLNAMFKSLNEQLAPYAGADSEGIYGMLNSYDKWLAEHTPSFEDIGNFFSGGKKLPTRREYMKELARQGKDRYQILALIQEGDKKMGTPNALYTKE